MLCVSTEGNKQMVHVEPLRYVVEAKDEFGWFDYATLSTEADAVRIAKELLESGEVKVIDKLNMLEVKII